MVPVTDVSTFSVLFLDFFSSSLELFHIFEYQSNCPIFCYYLCFRFLYVCCY
eukprot:UN22114